MRKLTFVLFLLVAGFALAQQPSAPEIRYRSVPNFLQPPANVYLGEVAGVAVNSKGHVFVFSRGNTTGANTAQTGPSGTLNPPYLNEFPSVDRIRREVKGSDPKDTSLRQLGAFRLLGQIVEDIKSVGPQWVHTQTTPYEQRLEWAYKQAADQIVLALNFDTRDLTHDPAFREGIFKQFGMNEVRARWEKGYADYQAKRQAQAAAAEQAKAGGANQPQGSAGTQSAMRNDPGSVAVRRCLELGGSEMHCLGKGMSIGSEDMLGVNLKSPVTAATTGLRMTGNYNGASGLAIHFTVNNLGITGCGKLIVDAKPYAMQKSGNLLLIRIENSPQPILAGLGPDGRIGAPAAAEVSGKIITGYTRTWVEQRYTSTNQVVPGSGHWEQSPIYAAATERCALGSLLPGPAAPAVSDQDGMLAMFEAAFAMVAGDPSASKNLIAPGPRLEGVYTGAGGLRAEFHEGGAVIDCQESHVAVPYEVTNTAGGVAVMVKNGASPFTLTLQPNGALAGAGTAEVHGRLVAGTDANGVTFRPVAARCAVGNLNLMAK